MKAFPTWTEQRAALEEAGIRPSRRLGQNFLKDANVSRAIARDAECAEGEFVLEIGPGLGCLTHALLEAGARVFAVEIDPRLLELARGHVEDRARFLRADVLAGKHRLAPEVAEVLPREGPWSVAANLPYSVSAPVLCVLSELPNPPRRMTVLVQREVADRLTARPGTPDWGPLSVRLQHAYGVERTREVAASVFWPRPKVESAVCRLELRVPGPGREERRRLGALTELLFQRRRQVLERVVGEALGPGGREAARELFSTLGLDGRARAETLSLANLCDLAASAAWRSRASGGSA